MMRKLAAMQPALVSTPAAAMGDPFADAMSPAAYIFAPPSGPASQGSYLSGAFNSNVTVVMAIVLFALVLVAFINTVARCRIMRRIRARQQSRAATAAGPLESQQQQQRMKGLEKDQIEALPVITYGAYMSSCTTTTTNCSKLDHDIIECAVESLGTASDDCAVCLSEYQKGEQVRLLPLCSHGFHLDCIATWLSTHQTCPVCRHTVLESPTYDPLHEMNIMTDPAPDQAAGLDHDHQSSAASSSREAS